MSEDNFFGNYGVESGYNQIAPGRDQKRFRVAGQPGRPRTATPQPVPSTVTQPAPAPTAAPPVTQPFAGAQQTLGTQQRHFPGTEPGSGFAGASNWMRNAAVGMGTPTATPMAAPPLQPPAAPAAPQATPDYRQAGKWLSNSPYGGSEKLNRAWDDKSEKWQYLTVASNFDPAQGLTPEFVKALNDANIYGTKWSGEGDKLSLLDAGTSRWKNTGLDDVIFNFSGGKPGEAQWNAWTDPAEQARRQAMQGGGGTISPQLLALLQGGTTAPVASPMAPAIAPEEEQFNSDRIRQQILEALQGGRRML